MSWHFCKSLLRASIVGWEALTLEGPQRILTPFHQFFRIQFSIFSAKCSEKATWGESVRKAVAASAGGSGGQGLLEMLRKIGKELGPAAQGSLGVAGWLHGQETCGFGGKDGCLPSPKKCRYIFPQYSVRLSLEAWQLPDCLAFSWKGCHLLWQKQCGDGGPLGLGCWDRMQGCRHRERKGRPVLHPGGFFILHNAWFS